MKAILLVFLICSFSASAQIPDYFTNDPRWACGSWSSNSWDNPPIPSTQSYTYYLNGDTTILGNQYRVLYVRGFEQTQSGPPPFPQTDFDEPTGYYLRQVGRSIRFYTDQIGSDSLLVDYDYAVGDTVAGDIFYTCGFNLDTIQEIDSILVGSEYRKVFYLDSITGPVITEGIGHLVEIGNNVGEFIHPLCGGIGFDYYLNCYGHGEVAEWDSQGQGGQCVLSVGLEAQSFEIQLLQNPVSNQIVIQNTLKENEELILLDLHGEQVARSFGNLIDVSHLANGTYLLMFLSSDYPVGQAKVIIQH